MAQLVLGVAGAVVGYYATGGTPQGAQYGFAIGSALGASYAASQKRIEGPKLNDLRLTGTEYGQPIPWIRGHPRVASQIWWASDKRQIANETSAGKGSGPTVVNYTYEIDVLLGLCDNEIFDVSRIWSNGKLIYSRLSGADAETLTSQLRLDTWRRLTVYTGASDQLPDPTYEAAVGVGNAPSYRGRGSVFIEGLQLDGAGQLPNLTFEVLTAGSNAVGDPVYIVQTNATLSPPSYFGPSSIATAGQTSFVLGIGQWDGSYLTTTVNCYEVSLFDAVPVLTGTFDVVRARPTSSGNSDTPVIAIEDATTTGYDFYDLPGGGRRNYAVGVTMTEEQMRFARKGSDVFITSQSGSVDRIYKFALAGGSPSATSAAYTQYNSLAVVGGYLYAACHNTNAVFRFDIGTMTRLTYITAPYPSASALWPILCDADGDLILIGPAPAGGFPYHAYRLDPGDVWTDLGGTFGTGFIQTSSLGQTAGIVGSQIVSGKMNTNGSAPYYYDIWTAPLTLTASNDTIQETVEALCDRAGLDAAQYDASALSTITRPVRAATMPGIDGVRGLLEQLRGVYGFDCSLSDKLYFRPRGGSSAATIAYAELGAGEEQATDDPLPIVVASDLELPPQIAVQFLNAANDYQIGTEMSDRLVMSTQAATQVTQTGIALLPEEAKGVADAFAAEAMAGLVSARVALGLQYAKLEPGDAIAVTASDGEVLRLRIGRRMDAGGVLQLETVLDDATLRISSEITDETYTDSNTVNPPSATLWRTLDIPILRDADDAPGWYVAAKGSTATWPGALVEQSWNGVDYSAAATVNESAVFGSCTTTLGNFTGVGVDEINTVTVTLAAGTLSSSTRDAMLVDETINAMLIGSEIIRFVTATLSSSNPNVYVLSRLFRGQRGTESFQSTHGAGENATLLRPQGLRRVAANASDIGRSRSVRATSYGQSSAYVTASAFTDTGVALKPFAPVDGRVSRDSSNNATVTWKRRSRLSGRLVATSGDPPLGEDSEAYDVLVYSDGTFATLKRTITATSATAAYSAADQTTDGVTPGNALNLRIYQRSATVGRGYALQVTA